MAFNLRTEETEAEAGESLEFEIILVYLVRPCLNKLKLKQK